MKRRYLVVYERSAKNYGASVPDAPGCVSVGDTWEEVHALIREGLGIYLDLNVEKGEPIPEPCTSLLDAMKHYATELPQELGDIYDNFAEVVEVTFGWVEVSAPDYAAVESSTAAASRIADDG